MAQAGLTPTTLSRQSKVSRDTIYRILAKETGAGEETLAKLSEAIGRPLPDLRTASDAPGSPAEPRSGEIAALEALRRRLGFLRQQLEAYRAIGQSPGPEVLAEWLRLTADLTDMRD